MRKGGAHGKQRLGRMCCVSSECVICGSNFSSIDCAKWHVHQSLLKGRCMRDQGRTDGKVLLPRTFECPACDYTASDNGDLRRHILAEDLQQHLHAHVLEIEVPGLEESIIFD
eukprot:7648341-Pyramimonas_sp.AAC.1